MIRQSTRTGLTCSTSSIQRDVIQAHGHRGSNQNCTSSRSEGFAVTHAATTSVTGLFPLLTVGNSQAAGSQPPGAVVPDPRRLIRVLPHRPQVTAGSVKAC